MRRKSGGSQYRAEPARARRRISSSRRRVVASHSAELSSSSKDRKPAQPLRRPTSLGRTHDPTQTARRAEEGAKPLHRRDRTRKALWRRSAPDHRKPLPLQVQGMWEGLERIRVHLYPASERDMSWALGMSWHDVWIRCLTPTQRHNLRSWGIFCPEPPEVLDEAHIVALAEERLRSTPPLKLVEEADARGLLGPTDVRTRRPRYSFEALYGISTIGTTRTHS